MPVPAREMKRGDPEIRGARVRIGPLRDEQGGKAKGASMGGVVQGGVAFPVLCVDFSLHLQKERGHVRPAGERRPVQ